MKIQAMKMDQDKARDLYKIYKKHQAWEQPEDYHIMRAYQLIAQGRVVIQAMQSIRQVGVGDNGLPNGANQRLRQRHRPANRASFHRSIPRMPAINPK